MLIFIKQWQEKVKPQQGANPLVVLFSWILFVLLLLIGLALGFVVLLMGFILSLPLMWRNRKQVKQMWQFTKATRKAQHNAKQEFKRQREHQKNRQDDSVIEGEYE